MIDMKQAWKLTCTNEPAAQIKITVGSSATWPFFLIELKKIKKSNLSKQTRRLNCAATEK